jgi:HD-GYP domain-containing protein (c-di-GMP phosphodiesterase class II)
MARLAAISTRLAGGDFSVRARRSSVRELDALGDNFNRMAGRLGDLVERFRAAAQEANAMFLGTIRSLAEAIDEKDPYTKGHSVRVNRYAVIIGRYLGQSREAIRALHVSALLHDVGKIGIDDIVLKKPAALTPDEFSTMKTHPERGAKIMGRIPQMKDIIPGIRFHHERWDGSGYPLGLRGEEIPMQARIIAVADTFDAMTTERPYQKSLTPAEAVALINDMKRIGFDPEVVEAFNRAYEAGEMQEVARSRITAARSDEDAGPEPVAGADREDAGSSEKSGAEGEAVPVAADS